MSRTTVGTEPGSRPPPEDDAAFFGRPKGLLTLSGLEVWERFSFLGMQAILVLHVADTVARGDMGMSAGTAAFVSAAFGTLVHPACGRLADRRLGSHRAVLWGGALIACGHYSTAVPTIEPAYLGVNRATAVAAGLAVVAAGLAVMAAAPWLRRTMHPVH